MNKTDYETILPAGGLQYLDHGRVGRELRALRPFRHIRLPQRGVGSGRTFPQGQTAIQEIIVENDGAPRI